MKMFTAVCFMVVGVALLVFAFMARAELYSAATAMTPPSPDEMPLIKIIGPELFRASPLRGATPTPGELAEGIMKKIYCVGGLGMLGVAGGVGVVFLPFKSSSKRPQNA